jgi:hypothetical protein
MKNKTEIGGGSPSGAMPCSTSSEGKLGKARPRFLCRWWLRVRPFNRDTIEFHRTAELAARVAEISCEEAAAKLDGALVAFSGLPLHVDEFRNNALVEVYVPWWAWPLELIHRAIFGRVILSNV